jgi:hypothetical protein
MSEPAGNSGVQSPVTTYFFTCLSKKLGPPIISALAIILVLSSASCSQPKPHLVQEVKISPIDYDLGELRQHWAKSATYTVSNQSNQPIDIVQLSGSCGCTRLEIDNRHINPQRKSLITATMDVKNHVGPIYSTIYIKWKNGATGQISQQTLFLRAKATRLAIFDPPLLEFSNQSAEKDTVSLPLVITPGDSGTGWDDVEIGDRNGSVKVSSVGFGIFKADIRICPSLLPLGSYRNELRVRFKNHGRLLNDVFTIPITANIDDGVQAFPHYLYLGLDHSGSSVSGRLKLEANHGKNMRVLNVSSTDPDSMQTTIQLQSPHEAVIAYTFNPSGRLKTNLRFIEIKMMLNEKPRILNVPYIAFLRS